MRDVNHDFSKRFVILDRDGVLNEDSDAYIKSVEEWIPIEGSLAAVARLNRAGVKVAVATNQSGLARGLFTQRDLDAMHKRLRRLLAEEGGWLDALEYCPHGPDDACDCRKPRAGLLRRIGALLRRNPTDAIVIGDSLRDLQAAETVNAQPVLVRTGKGRRTEAEGNLPPDARVYDTLADAVDAILREAM
ncbi:MAG TPA: D-glycero-beta-D-manno-heptose 1,7-bisphosphate 7-phosphatase [Gammaproteobacteria bacterium]|nr:D-glycero-beta-D-manno-heptose 1,7-bisphosphate 7-phosphatase [Gammaproteobacteria bacterium]